MPPPELSYERQPPVGNALIDDEAGTIFIRIFPDRSVGRLAAWVFAIVSLSIVFFIFIQMDWTRGVSILQFVPLMFAATLLLVMAFTMRYSARNGFTTILASSAGVEYSAGGFAPRIIERNHIQRVFTRDVAFSSRMSLCLRMTDGTDMVLGTGISKEIDAMAKALHRVLNSAQPVSTPD